MKTYNGKITELKENQIFVFGSNTEGRHGKGAALLAFEKFGAIYGKSEGRMGQCYDYDVVKFGDIYENLDIPGDVTVDGQFRQKVTGWSVGFYDENGKMLEVKITGINEGDDIDIPEYENDPEF